MRRGSKLSGFTLVELMVVIIIIGLASAVVVLAVPETGGSLRSEAERFAARAKAARDAAIVEARPAALAIGPDGYGLARREAGEWRTTAQWRWSEGTSAAAGGEARTRFDSTGLAEPLSVTLRRGRRSVAVDIGADGSVRVRH